MSSPFLNVQPMVASGDVMCNNKLRVRGHGVRCINCKHRLHVGR
jgi:hypothetical protein